MGLMKKIAKDKNVPTNRNKIVRQVSKAARLASELVLSERKEAQRLYRREQAQMELSMMNQVIAMFLYILHDKHGYGKKRLIILYNQVCDLAKIMNEMKEDKDSNPVDIYSILGVLEDECGIKINPPNTPLPVIMGGKSLGEDSFGNIRWEDVHDEGINTAVE